MKRCFVALAAALAVCFACGATAALAGVHDAVSSEGGEAVAAPVYSATMASSPPFAGTGGGALGLLVTGEADDTQLLFHYTGRSIIDTDTRTRVRATTTYPYRANALITWRIGPAMSICTGWFISSNTIATAGHCVHEGGGGSNGWYDRSTYRIYPGRNGALAPYGACTAKALYSVSGWTTSGYEYADYGAIRLNCDRGEKTGWYGLSWSSAKNMNGLPATIAGYPVDKMFGTMWRSRDVIRLTQPRRLFYENDTIGGQSGSAVYRYATVGGKPGYYAMAVHAYGTYGLAPFAIYNHGTRITQAVFNNLMSWIRRP